MATEKHFRDSRVIESWIAKYPSFMFDGKEFDNLRRANVILHSGTSILFSHS